MDWDDFCNFLEGELPLNRKERFYTGTVLPALLFHNGLSNFYTFLRGIKGFPTEINKAQTKDNFLFYTEYNLKESAGDRNIGRRIVAKTNDTPDVVIEILQPKRIFVIIEAKMFAKVSQEDLRKQILRQKKYVGNILKEAFLLEDKDFYYLALVPRDLNITSTSEFQVIYWEDFIEKPKFKIADNIFYNYLKCALKNYRDLVQIKRSSLPPYIEGQKLGAEVYESGKAKEDFWVGRQGGKKSFVDDIKNDDWADRKYYFGFNIPKEIRIRQWISCEEFTDLVDRYSS